MGVDMLAMVGVDYLRVILQIHSPCRNMMCLLVVPYISFVAKYNLCNCFHKGVLKTIVKEAHLFELHLNYLLPVVSADNLVRICPKHVTHGIVPVNKKKYKSASLKK